MPQRSTSMSSQQSGTTTFVLQPTSDDNWVFFPQPNFSTAHDDDDDDDDDDEREQDETERERERIETESWVSTLWCKIFKAKSPSSSRTPSVNGDFEKSLR